MPTYQFCFDGDVTGPETVTRSLPDMAAAKCEAAKTVGMMICDAGSKVWEDENWNVSVTDDAGLILFTLMIIASDAPAIKAPPPPAYASAVA